MSLAESLKYLQAALSKRFPKAVEASEVALDELTVDIQAKQIQAVCFVLRDDFHFDQLIDVCGVDYLLYRLSEWETEATTATGFSRATTAFHQDRLQDETQEPLKQSSWSKPRFAVVYHLLSVKDNKRIRLRAFIEESNLEIDSVTPIWAAANWFEREAFDLFGIRFKGHPDLRRLLTDYGFVGHPFRKDFPLIGQVEMRYDAKSGKCVYEPVSIQPRVTVPKVIRKDHRHLITE